MKIDKDDRTQLALMIPFVDDEKEGYGSKVETIEEDIAQLFKRVARVILKGTKSKFSTKDKVCTVAQAWQFVHPDHSMEIGKKYMKFSNATIKKKFNQWNNLADRMGGESLWDDLE